MRDLATVQGDDRFLSALTVYRILASADVGRQPDMGKMFEAAGKALTHAKHAMVFWGEYRMTVDPSRSWFSVKVAMTALRECEYGFALEILDRDSLPVVEVMWA